MAPNSADNYTESLARAFEKIDARFEKFEAKLDSVHTAVTTEFANVKLDIVLLKKHEANLTAHCKMDPDNGRKCVSAETLNGHLDWHVEEQEKKAKRKKWWIATVIAAVPVIGAIAEYFGKASAAIRHWISGG